MCVYVCKGGGVGVTSGQRVFCLKFTILYCLFYFLLLYFAYWPYKLTLFQVLRYQDEAKEDFESLLDTAPA